MELTEVAEEVRNNLQSLFERGEKMESLYAKAEKLKAASIKLKKKAIIIKEQNDPPTVLSLWQQLLGI